MANPFSIFGTLSELLKLLTTYVRHRTETDLDRRITQSRETLRALATEVDELRSDGSPAATQHADWLRGEYRTEAEHLKYLLSRRARAEAGSGDRDG